RSIANGMRARRAGGHNRMVGALKAMPDRNVTRGQVDEPSGDEEGTDAARAFFLEEQRRLGDAREPADAWAAHGSGALLLLCRIGFPACVLERLLGGGHGVDDKVVDLALLLGFHPIVGIELALA